MSVAAIFDVDGTLLDSMQVWEYFARNFLRRCGVPVREDADDVVRYMCLSETAEFFINECGVVGTVEEVMAECNKMLEEEYRIRFADITV
jgi:beta-phosphoglucomutase-like phosphatase (HAD superfamily)